MNIAPVSIIATMLGILLTVIILVMIVFLLVMCREANPFSEWPSAGETFQKGLLWISLKILVTIFVQIDSNGSFQTHLTVILTFLLIFFIGYSHYEVGLYKIGNR